ncbi:hypothetical protein BU23DRAFT_449988 [Bimuria novae-zelandiae CBS 107.79]|uniref:F-box domain-containing protein n=1 Tax=Bimuria novae-zelandiae CBS 107.79 TaxID=1447943 RepID=A0A6A5VU37_9PLEO|nr:hypothetical protein BU23DRAFT_449988 [Bimuria novae-zelandiae CBS 107.79]
MESASLPGLPVELVQEIQSLLTYSSGIALRFTCRALYFNTDKPGPSYEMSDLLAIETWPRYNDASQRPSHFKRPIADEYFFTCPQCLRIRSALYFSNKMMRAKRGKTSSAEDKRKRIFIECGIESGRYRKGMNLQYGGAPVFGIAEHTRVVCWDCGEFYSLLFTY